MRTLNKLFNQLKNWLVSLFRKPALLPIEPGWTPIEHKTSARMTCVGWNTRMSRLITNSRNPRGRRIPTCEVLGLLTLNGHDQRGRY